MITVLLVDDEPVLLDLAKLFLERDPSFRILTALSADEAWKIIDHEKIDAIVSDFEMPQKNGIEFLKDVRGAGKKIPFIVFTGRGREEVVINAIESGADFYIQKGGDPKSQFAELKQKISHAVSFQIAERERKSSEELYRTLFESANDGIVILEDGRIVECNHRALEMFHLSRNALMGKTIPDLSPPFQQDGLPSTESSSIKISQALTGQPQHFEWEHLLADKTSIMVDVSLTRLITGSGGDRIQALAIIRDITERKQFEEELSSAYDQVQATLEEATASNQMLLEQFRRADEDERFLASLMTNLPGMVYRCRNDRDWTMIFVSEGCRNLTGYDPQDLLENRVISYNDIITQDFQELIWNLWQESLNEKKTLVSEYTIRRKDGKIRWVWERGHGIFSEDGDIISIEGFITDITERKEVEDALRKSEEIQRNLIDFLPDPTLALNTEGRVIAWNRAMVRLTGVPAKEILGKGDYAHSIPFYGKKRPILVNMALIPDQEFLSTHYTNITWEGNTLVAETGESIINGVARILWMKAEPLFGPDGSVTGAIESVRDITHIRKTEEQLRKREEMYRLLTENQTDVVIAVTPDEILHYCSPSVKEFGGYNSEEEMGNEIHQYFVDEEEYKSTKKILKQMMEVKEPASLEFLYRARNKDPFPVEIRLSPIIEDDQVVMIQGAMRDVSERRALEDQLKIAFEEMQGAYEEARSAQEVLEEQNQVLDERERFLSTLLQNIPGIVIRFNPDTNKIHYISGDVSGLTGYDADRISNNEIGYDELIQHEDIENLKKMRISAYDADKIFEGHYLIRHADGSSRWVLERSRLINNEGREEKLVEGVLIDATSERKAEDALKHSYDTIRHLFDNTSDGIILHDDKGSIVEVNRQMHEIFSLREGEEKSWNVTDLSAPEVSDEELKEYWQQTLNKDYIQFEWQAIRPKDGTRLFIEVRLRKIEIDQKTLILANIRDITSRKETEKEKEEIARRQKAEWEGIFIIAKNSSLSTGLIDDFSAVCTRVISDSLSAFSSSLWLMNEAKDELISSAVCTQCPSENPVNRIIKKKDYPLLFKILENEFELRIGEEYTTPGLEDLSFLFDESVVSVIAGVIRVEGECAGIVCAASDISRRWYDDERFFLLQCSELTAGALQASLLRKQRDLILEKNEEIEAAYKELSEIEENLRQTLSELREKEVKLVASENHYRSIFEYSGEASGIVTPELTFTQVNTAFERLSGYSRDEIENTLSITDFIRSEDQKRIEGHIRRLIQGKIERPVSDEMQFVTRDKVVRYVAVLIGAIPHTSDILISMLDISDRIRMMEELTEARKRLDTTLNAIPDLLVELDDHGDILDMRFHDPIQLTSHPSYVIGKNIDEILTSDASEILKNAISKAREDGMAYGITYRYSSVKGPGWYELSIVRKGEKESPDLSYIAISRDVTSRKMMEDALYLANHKLNILSGVTRHDILNQITVCRGYLDLISDEGVEGDLRTYIWKLATLIGDIQRKVEFTREYQDIGIRAASWVDIRSVITEAMEGFRDKRCSVADGCNSYEIFADTMIGRVFINLIENAQRHGKNLTEIHFSCSRDGNDLIIDCRDDGGGIPDANKEIIFERGFGQNTGFGLFLVREILSITGLTIIEKGEYKKGAWFEIRVPAGTFRKKKES